MKVSARTLIEGEDKGNWTVLSELMDYQQQACEALKREIEKVEPDEWDKVVVTKEFGEKKLSEAFGRVVTHTAYHAGQLALVLKYGK